MLKKELNDEESDTTGDAIYSKAYKQKAISST